MEKNVFLGFWLIMAHCFFGTLCGMSAEAVLPDDFGNEREAVHRRTLVDIVRNPQIRNYVLSKLGPADLIANCQYVYKGKEFIKSENYITFPNGDDFLAIELASGLEHVIELGQLEILHECEVRPFYVLFERHSKKFPMHNRTITVKNSLSKNAVQFTAPSDCESLAFCKVTSDGVVVGRGCRIEVTRTQYGEHRRASKHNHFFIFDSASQKLVNGIPGKMFIGLLVVNNEIITTSCDFKHKTITMCLWDKTGNIADSFEMPYSSGYYNGFRAGACLIVAGYIVFSSELAGIKPAYIYVLNRDTHKFVRLDQKNVYDCIHHNGKIFTSAVNGKIGIFDIETGQRLAIYRSGKLGTCALTMVGNKALAATHDYFPLVEKWKVHILDVGIIDRLETASDDQAQKIMECLQSLPENTLKKHSALYWAEIARIVQDDSELMPVLATSRNETDRKCVLQ